jgi:hypothetical protein
VIAFDEYLGHRGWPGDEHRALAEAAATFGWRFDVLALSWFTGQLVVRIS